jgi:N-terminal acetyltransferase B complex non-catalytic subunit
LADWLEPYHDYSRPPPAVVLAEAAKQTELKTGHPLKGVELHHPNGTNGHKKDESPPTIQEPPVLVVKYFDGMCKDLLIISTIILSSALLTRFDEVNPKASVSEILHLATIAQEVWLSSSSWLCSKVNVRQSFLLFVVETIRFKNSVLVKTNKLGAVS